MSKGGGNDAKAADVCGSGRGSGLLLPGNTGEGAAGRRHLKLGHFDSPASMSMLEESTVAVNRPMMGVFNNLVIFKQDEQQNTPRYDRPGARDSVGLERGRHRTDVFAAPRRQVA
jgi:hypothetical protein